MKKCGCREAICQHNADWDLSTALVKNKNLESENARLMEALTLIATVNACDYEYVEWAKKALEQSNGQ